MPFRQLLSSFLQSHPPSSIPFRLRSAVQKSSDAATLHDLACHLSPGIPDHIYQHFLRHTRAGKTVLPEFRHASKSDKVLSNLRSMHNGAPDNQKSNILSLVAAVYSKSELKDDEFRFSNDQFTTAGKKARNQTFT